MIEEDDIRKVNRFFSKHPEIAAAYIFGSVATGRDRKSSDMDLSIMFKGDPEPMKRIRMETDLSNLLRRDVDLVIFAQGSPLLQRQVLCNGRLIYEADPAERVRQEVIARKIYFDTAHLYRKIKRSSAHG